MCVTESRREQERERESGIYRRKLEKCFPIYFSGFMTGPLYTQNKD